MKFHKIRYYLWEKQQRNNLLPKCKATKNVIAKQAEINAEQEDVIALKLEDNVIHVTIYLRRALINNINYCVKDSKSE